jgi:hypothetical protein
MADPQQKLSSVKKRLRALLSQSGLLMRTKSCQKAGYTHRAGWPKNGIHDEKWQASYPAPSIT